MANYPVSNLVGLNPSAIGAGDGTTNAATTPTAALGQSIYFSNGRYQYIKAAGTIAMYDVVNIANDNTAVSATSTTNSTANPSRVGIADQAGFTTGQYGWVFVGDGTSSVNAAASTSNAAKLYVSATPGVVTSTAGTALINGLKLITSTTGAAVAPCYAVGELGTVLA